MGVTGGDAGSLGEDRGGALQAVRYMVTNLPTEQYCFLVAQFSALGLAFLFRWYLSPPQCGAPLRHSAACLLGLCLSLYCFGWLTLFLIGEVALGYLLLITTDPSRVHLYTLLVTMGYLTAFHVRRFITPYEDQIDFTVPLMVLTQKISKVAFEFHDGSLSADLSPSQRRLAIRVPPSPLSYASYTVGFLGLLAGPLCSYNDYQRFILGEERRRNPAVAVRRKLCLCSLLLAAHLTLSDRFSVSCDPHRSLIGRFLDLYLTAASRRPKYYFAWTLGETSRTVGPRPLGVDTSTFTTLTSQGLDTKTSRTLRPLGLKTYTSKNGY
ncbi:membrane-bound glycerophospholipid O-acyltransferase 2-like [Ascaphus truei]|uniref:membrane-bound glycerophospholipid O-acyltransferase 2-like n=1 Tax=Ascaphus truei TaxID=8439 RepID=UPI003F5A1F85